MRSDVSKALHITTTNYFMGQQSILNKVSNEKNLHAAWKKLNKTRLHSHGASGVTIEQFKANLDDHIANISKELKKGIYRFSPNRAVVVQKDNGTYRPLQVPEIRDRLVLKSIAIELESQFRSVLIKSKGLSFAYQKKLGIRQAFEKIEEHYTNGYKTVLETDIVNFFGEVNKTALLTNDVFPKLSDSSINDLIEQGLNQQISGIEKLRPEQAEVFKDVNSGIPQGNPLSPLLSNIYLSSFDEFMNSRSYKMVRYADDFVVMCKDENEAKICFDEADKFLQKELKLKLYGLNESSKTSITDPSKGKFVFLSICFDGNKMYPSRKNVDKFKNKIRSVCNINTDQISVIGILTKVKNRYEGWMAAFFFTDVDRYAEEIDFFIDRQLLLSLAKMDWKFKGGTIGKLPHNYKHDGASGECLSKKQRVQSGVPEMATFLRKIREQDIIPKELDKKLPKKIIPKQKVKTETNIFRRAVKWIFG